MFEPIVPKRPIFKMADLFAQLTRRMNTLTADLQRECAEYEPPASLNYVRTNMLKKSWSRKAAYRRGDALIGEVLSSGQVAPYNMFVRGPRKKQARAMQRRGWRSVEDIMDDYWPEAQTDFTKIIEGAGK